MANLATRAVRTADYKIPPRRIRNWAWIKRNAKSFARGI